jgi:hypothetical protein
MAATIALLATVVNEYRLVDNRERYRDGETAYTRKLKQLHRAGSHDGNCKALDR